MLAYKLKIAAALLLVGAVVGLSAGQEPRDKPPPAEPKKEPSPVDSLKERLKKHEAELAKIRAAMLKEVEDELKKLDEAIKEAEKALADARNDRDARQKAFIALSKARSDRSRVQMQRYEVERMVNIPGPAPARVVPPEQRLGLHTTPVSGVLAAQLQLDKGKGLVVERVDAKSPADAAGVRANDVLTQVAGKPVPGDLPGLRKLLGEIEADKEFDVVLLRGGKEETLKGLKVPPEASK